MTNEVIIYTNVLHKKKNGQQADCSDEHPELLTAPSTKSSLADLWGFSQATAYLTSNSNYGEKALSIAKPDDLAEWGKAGEME